MIRIAYDQLVRDYLESLNSKLRNFSVQEEFLATWVHDEDPHVSLFEIFATAKSSGCPALTVAVGPVHARTLDEKRVMEELSRLGSASLTRTGEGGWEIVVELSGPLPVAPIAAPEPASPPPKARTVPPAPAAKPAPPGEIHPAYRAALKRLAAAPRFEKPAPPAPPGGLTLEAADGALRLAVAVGPDGVVLEAAHAGASGELRGLFEGLCGVLQGRPLREGRDHAVIRLESLLRDRSANSPVPGLLTPKNADPIFRVPEALLRELYRRWAESTGAPAGWNFWDELPAPSWRALSAGEKLSRTKAAVLGGCRRLGVGEAGIEILEILNDCRIVLAATPETTDPKFAPWMMRLEGLVKLELDPRLELQLESLEDRNRRAQRTARTEKLS